MPLPEFANEADFRDNWIMPFLTARGFIHVHDTHGPGEQGKDFFFADRDAFDHLRIYALQAKYGNIGGGDVETDKLLNQVRRCFTVPLRCHHDVHDRHVSAVYVMATGRISQSAREYIWNWCADEKRGESVYFLDGETLDRLEVQQDHLTHLERVEMLRYLTEGCKFNLHIVGKHKQAFSESRCSAHRLRTRHFEDSLPLLINHNQYLYREVSLALEYCERLNVANNHPQQSAATFDEIANKLCPMAESALHVVLQVADNYYAALMKSRAISITTSTGGGA